MTECGSGFVFFDLSQRRSQSFFDGENSKSCSQALAQSNQSTIALLPLVSLDSRQKILHAKLRHFFTLSVHFP
jgi:hypothetical protein